jgi:hypothetical protein
MMKTVKVLVGVAILALLMVMFLFSQKARADGMHGVRETATEILVEVPKFCRPLKVVWEIRWEQEGDSKEIRDILLKFIETDKGAKLTVPYLKVNALKLSAMWRGGQTVHIPKFDAKGKPIKITHLSIVALSEEFIDLSPNNWGYASQNSRWVDGASIAPPVRVGVWGKCT